jgi:hypothetical protein
MTKPKVKPATFLGYAVVRPDGTIHVASYGEPVFAIQRGSVLTYWTSECETKVVPVEIVVRPRKAKAGRK